MGDKEKRVFTLDGDTVSVHKVYDEDIGQYIFDYPDFDEHPRFTPGGRRWVNVMKDDCPYACGEFGDCGSCRFFRCEHPGDLVGICINDKLSEQRKEEKPMKTINPVLRKIMSVFLAVTVLLGVLPVSGLLASADTAKATASDAVTIDQWKDWFPENDSRYAGGVFVDKSVFTADSARDYFANDISDKLTFGKDNFGNENFLVALSGIGSNSEIKGYSTLPSDSMLVLDLSNSMSSTDVREMVTSANRAIQRLLELNNYNRVGVVLYSGNNSTRDDATTSTGTVILPLGRYTTTRTETVDNAEYKVYLTASTGNNQSVSVASNAVKPEGSDGYLSGSKSASGATYMQNGIFLAYKQFESAPDKTIPEGQVQGGTTRTPIIVLMGDGAPTIGTTNYSNVGTSNYGNGGSESSRLAFLTQLTAAWSKAKIASLYGINYDDVKLYTLGLGTSGSQNATDVLNPSNNNSGTSSMWNNFINNNANDQGNVTVAGNGGDSFRVPKDTTGMLTSVTQRNYVTRYWAADDADDMVKAFDSIVSEIVTQSQTLQNTYYSTLVSSDANTDGYISFTDEIGTYMEVKDMKGIHIGNGTLVTGDMFADYMSNDKIIAADGTLTDLGVKFMSAMEDRFGITGTEALALVNNAVANGFIYYNSQTDFSNYVAWYADKDNNYLGAYSALARTAAPEGAKYLVKSYIYLGDVSHHVETNMLYTLIRVREDLTTGRQIVDANLPAALLPMITYTIEIEGEELTEDSIKGMTSNADSVSPATLLYEVGLRNDITPYNIAEKVKEDFRFENGVYTFYTNRWRADDGTAFTVPETVSDDIFNHGVHNTTVTQFIPSLENQRYYYIEDTLILQQTATGYAPVTTSSAPTGTGYYHMYQYVAVENGEAKLKTVYNPITANAINNYATNINGQWYIASGTPKAYFNYQNNDNDHSVKVNQQTNTLSWSNYPDLAFHAEEGHTGYHIINYLGNNGKLSVSPAQGIRLSKTVSQAVDGAGDTFNFDITLTGFSGTLDIRVEDEAGNFISKGTVDVINGDMDTVSLKDGQVAYITDIPGGTAYTVTEQNDGYYLGVGTNTTGTVSDHTLSEVDFVNSPKGYGSLLISKDVVHTFEDVVPAAVTSKEFNISVTFAGNADDLALIDTPTGATKNGNTYSFKLSHDEDILFVGIPEGVTYTVTETLVNANYGDADYGFTKVTADNDLTGSIVKDTRSVATVVNSYEYGEITGAAVTLNGTKTVTGDGFIWEDESFTVLLQPVSIGGTSVTAIGSPITVDATITSDAPTYNYNMSGLTYDAPGTYSYMVYELTPTTGAIANMAYDTSYALFSITVTDNDADGRLEISDVVNHRGTADALVENDGSWTVTKNFNNQYQAENITFTVQKYVEVNGAVEDSHEHDSGIMFGLFENITDTDPVFYAITDANGVATFSINALQDAYSSEKTYYLREITPLLESGVIGMTYDKGWKYTVTIHWPDGGDLSVEYKDYNTGENVSKDELSITNSYDETIETGSVIIGGEKTLNGGTMDLRDFDDFVFYLYKTDADFAVDASAPLLDSKTVDAADTAYTFNAVKFGIADEGTHYFVVKEQGAGTVVNGMTYTRQEYHITVNVDRVWQGDQVILEVSSVILHQTGGSTVGIFADANGDFIIDSADFDNTYTVTDSEKVTVGGKKNLTGRDLFAGDFTFGLYEGNELITSVKNDAQGYFTFDIPAYTKVEKHTYTVKEIIPDDTEGVDYDTKEYTVVVDVFDNGDGTLGHSVTVGGNAYTEDSIVFNNDYSAEDTSITLSGTKTLGGKEIADGQFTFNVYETGSDFVVTDAPLKSDKNNKTGDNTGDWSVTIDYTNRPEDVKVHYYVVNELIPQERLGVSYDTREYRITVEVVDNGHGELVAAVKSIVVPGRDGQFSIQTLNFNNNYSVADTDPITISGDKELIGKTLEEGDFTFLLYESDAAGSKLSIPIEAVNAADGSFTFDKELIFSAEGTYYYLVTEKDTYVERITYDTAEYLVIITVEDKQGIGVYDVDITYTVGDDEADAIRFENTYTPKPEDITVDIDVLKTVKNVGSEKIGPENFTFVLEKDGNADDKLEKRTDADGKASFTLTFTEDDIDETYTYKLYEKDEDRENVQYSKAVYDVTVAISLNEDNELVAELKVGDDTVDTIEASFENVYDYTPPTNIPDTGIYENFELLLALFFVSGAGLLTMGFCGIRRRNAE